MRLLLAFAVVAAILVAPQASAAVETEVVVWRLEVVSEGQPADCTLERLGREVALACEALGGRCAVGVEGRRTATLRCGEAWTLEAHKESGSVLWTVPIESDADRMRKVAMWIARAPSDAPTVKPAPPLPEPPLPEPVVTALPPPRITIAEPLPVAEAPAGHLKPASQRASGVLGSTRASYVGGGFGPMLGGRVAAAFAPGPRNLAVAGAIGGGRTTSGTEGFGYSSGHLGAAVGWGAPWGPAPVGVSLEGGAELVSISAPTGVLPTSHGLVRGYGEAALTTQWNGLRALRPFASLSASIFSDRVSVAVYDAAFSKMPQLAAALDVGVAWRSW